MARRLKSVWRLFKEATSNWVADKVPMHGAALAFYTMFSMSPLVVIFVAIAGVWFGREVARERIAEELGAFVGDQAAEALQEMLENVAEPGRGLVPTVIALGTLAVGVTIVFAQLQDSLNTIWRVRPKPGHVVRSFAMTRALSFLLVIVIGLVLLTSFLLSTALAAMGKWVTALEVMPSLRLFWQGLDFAVSLGVLTVVFAMIYKLLPDVKIAWRDVWVGSAVTAFLFVLGKFVIGFYFATAAPASAYGAAGSLAALLLWVYYSSMLIFFGAELTQAYANQCGSKVVPADYAEFISGAATSQEDLRKES